MSAKEENQDYIDDWSTFLRRSRIQFEENWQRRDNRSFQMKNFTFIRKIGEGAFGRVVLAKKNTSYYAVKIITKSEARRKKSLDQVQTERRVLQATKFSFIVNMEYYFYDSQRFYFVMPFISGGDLWALLRKQKRFSESVSQFYSSQVLLALEYLHYLNILYRDLKPENILLDASGYLKLADLGFCKKIYKMTYTFCGTTEYMAPEVIQSLGYGFSADWWSFGVLVYEMVRGTTPFVAMDELNSCRNIVYGEYMMPLQFSFRLRDLVKKLLLKDPSQRLGTRTDGAWDVKNHQWFDKFDWMAVLNRKMAPPFLPRNCELENASQKQGRMIEYVRNGLKPKAINQCVDHYFLFLKVITLCNQIIE